MPNYNLEDFKAWLNADPTRWEKLNPKRALKNTTEREFGTMIQTSRSPRYNFGIFKIIKKWQNAPEQREPNNMTNYRQEFKNWLEEDTSRKQNLPNWEEFFNIFIINSEKADFDLDSVVYFIWNTNDTPGNIEKYFDIYDDWKHGSTWVFSFFGVHDLLLEKKQEFTQLSQEKQTLETKLQDHTTTLTATRQQLDQSKSELTKNQQKVAELTKKIEDLSKNRLSESEMAVLNKIGNFVGIDEKEDRVIEKVEDFYKELDQLEMNDFDKYIKQVVGDVSFALESWANSMKCVLSLEETIKKIADQLKIKEQELTTLQQQSTASTAPLRQEITDLKKQLQASQDNYQKAKEELQKSQQERDQLTVQIQELANKNQDLETQITALFLSSGLLTQQCEDLSTKLTESERKEIQTKLENDIKANLLVQKEQELKGKDTTITEQAAKINKYQNILRQSEVNLTNCQKIITAKEEELTKLEEEKENIQNELEASQEKIKKLEESFLNSQAKILELETRIQELEQDNSKDSEIVRLKQQLKEAQQEKNKFNQETKKLQDQLAQIKLREEQLSQKIKQLSKSPVKFRELQAPKSLWQTIKTPLFYTSGIILVIIIVGWIYGLFNQE